jgi:hypothetical protein
MAVGRVGQQPGTGKAMGLPGGRGSPIERMILASVSWGDGLLVGGVAWPPHQLPPATGCPSAAAARRASATCQSDLGGLLVPIGDALLGQGLAEPGMLVVHGPSPFPPARPHWLLLWLSMAMRPAHRIRQVPYAGGGV